jgi:hypothetical protein
MKGSSRLSLTTPMLANIAGWCGDQQSSQQWAFDSYQDLKMPYEFTQQYPREDKDFYVEPVFCSARLFEKIKFTGTIHDPACGIGTITTIAKGCGYEVSTSDLIARSSLFSSQDYLQDFTIRDNIVTNPPYNLAEEFINHARTLTRYKVAVLARLAFLEGQARYKYLYKPHPPSNVLVFSTRPSMPPYGQPVGGGKTAYCWIIWDQHDFSKITKLDWIINNG